MTKNPYTPAQLRQAAVILTKIVTLQSRFDAILGNGAPARPKRKFSAATKKKMAAAAKARWAKRGK